MKMTKRGALAIGVACAAALSAAGSSTSFAQPAPTTKGNRWLIKNGFQIQGMVNIGDPFTLSTYQGLNYTAVNFLWDSNVSALGPAPGSMPWARWVRPPTPSDPDGELPPIGGEGPYMSNLIALSMGDEPDLNNATIRQQYIDWFNAVRSSYPNQLLYMNNYGGQVTDGPLGDFIARGQPDMISFDTYPYRFTGPGTGVRTQHAGGSPTNFYGDLRRYREHARGANIPLGVYRQTYESVTEGVRKVSESELRLMTFGSLAFNAKYLTDFTYNTGASAFFNNAAGGDNSPNALYTAAQQINLEARRLGPALVRLKPLNDAVPGSYTTGVMFIRGKHDAGGTTALNPVPIGFVGDGGNPNAAYTEWTFGVNDPYLSGPFNDPGTTNLGTFNNGLDGDVILSWFTPSDEWFDGDDWSNQRYLMVTNGLADMDATGAQTRQQIKLNFGSSGVRYPYTSLQKLDRNTGQVVNVPLTQLSTNVWQLDTTIDGGTAELFKFPTGAPFVGTLPPDAIWTSSTNGAYTDGTKWDIGTTPNGNYLVHFGSTTSGTGPTYTVSFSGNIASTAAFVHRDHVTWSIAPPGIAAPSPAATFTQTGVAGLDSLVVGMNSGETASLTVSGGGVLRTEANPGQFTQIGKASGATGTMSVTNATWHNATDMLIGKSGFGRFNVSGILAGGPQTVVNLTNVYLGGTPTAAAGGHGEMHVTSGTVNVAGMLKVWPGNSSQVNLSGGKLNVGTLDTAGDATRLNWIGGTLETPNLTIASVANGGLIGDAMTLNNSMTLNVPQTLTVGGFLRMEGTSAANVGTLNLTNFGTLVLAGGTLKFTTLNQTSSLDAYVPLTVSGPGAGATFTHTSGSLNMVGQPLIVGAGTGTGTFVHSGGGMTAGGAIRIAVDPGSTGTVTLADMYSGSDIHVGGSNTAAGGTGVLNINSGFVTVNGPLKVWNTGAAAPGGTRVNFSGGQLSVGSIDLNGNPARFNWTGGTLIFQPATSFTIGNGGMLGPSLTLAPGMALQNGATVTVGATGSLTIAGGSLAVQSLNATSGAFSFPSGTLNMTNTSPTVQSLFGTAADATFGGNIIGVGGIRKSGTGTLTLAGNNTYTGKTQITAGTLAVSASTNLGNGGANNLIEMAGGTLRTTGSFNTSRALTVFSGAIDATGQTLTFDGAGNTTWLGGNLDILGGTVAFARTGGITGPAAGSKVTIHPGATVNLGGTVAALGNIDVVNNSTASLNVNAGAQNLWNLSGSGHTTIAAGASLLVNHVRQADAHVAGTLTVRPNSFTQGTSEIDELTIADGGKFDLGANKLITRMAIGTEAGGVYDGIQGLVQSGHNAGAWDGDGLVTTQADALAARTSLGVATADSTGYVGGTFGGRSVEAGDVLVMYTWVGDANFDGFVSADDYSAIDFAVGVAGADGWANGDFNYDGFISADDYSAIDFMLVDQGAPFPTGEPASAGPSDVTSVPEPGAACVLSLVATLAAAVRRRQRRHT